MKTYFISFCGDSGNLGVCIVDAMSEPDAITKTHYLNINPGGEAMLFELLPHMKDGLEEVRELGKDKLISPDDMLKRGYHKIADLPEDKRDEFVNQQGITVMCEDCNNNRCTKHGHN